DGGAERALGLAVRERDGRIVGLRLDGHAGLVVGERKQAGTPGDVHGELEQVAEWFPPHGSAVCMGQPHWRAGAGEEALDVTDGGGAVAEDAGGERGVRAGEERIAEVLRRSGAPTDDDRHGNGAGDGAGEFEVVAAAAAILVDAGEQDLASAAL